MGIIIIIISLIVSFLLFQTKYEELDRKGGFEKKKIFKRSKVAGEVKDSKENPTEEDKNKKLLEAEATSYALSLYMFLFLLIFSLFLKDLLGAFQILSLIFIPILVFRILILRKSATNKKDRIISNGIDLKKTLLMFIIVFLSSTMVVSSDIRKEEERIALEKQKTEQLEKDKKKKEEQIKKNEELEKDVGKLETALYKMLFIDGEILPEHIPYWDVVNKVNLRSEGTVVIRMIPDVVYLPKAKIQEVANVIKTDVANYSSLIILTEKFENEGLEKFTNRDRLSLEIYAGDTLIGRSKVMKPSEIKWKDFQ